jgi:DNA-binding CsgD family transcriptional regulator
LESYYLFVSGFQILSLGLRDYRIMQTLDPILTKEERDILVMVAVHPDSKHLSNDEIGKRLGISVTRVKTLMHEACIKLNAHNRNEATLLAMRRGEIHLNELLSLDELAEILSTVDPDLLMTIANTVRQNPVQKVFPQKDDQIINQGKRHLGVLTNRERDVLILVSRGLTNEEIADNLCMTTSAVRTFLNRAFSKLGASKRADAVQLALKRQEINIGEISSEDELLYYLAPLGADSIEKIARILEMKHSKGPMISRN